MKNDFKNINKELQFYNTPLQTTQKILELIDFKCENLDILEPSAGQGGILKEIIKKYPNNNYYYCEFLDYNKDKLQEELKDKAKFICNDFLKINEYTDKQFDLIIANPPFNKNQDIIHFSKMIDICKKDGYIISILSNSWRKRLNQKIVNDFIKVLNTNKTELIELDYNSFSNIGLNIETCILKLKKENNIFSQYNYDFSIKQKNIEIEPVYIEDFKKTIFDYALYKMGINGGEKVALKDILFCLLEEE